MSDEKISDFPTWVGGIVPPAGQVPFIFGGVNYKASWTQITGPTLGLGTMAYQDSNAVSITGGSVATSALSGTVAIANGGTAATTVPAARVNLLPPYAGNAGKVLALNGAGTDVQWIPAPGTGTVTSVNVSGGTTGLGTTGGPVTTTGTITLNGTLNAASGGTGLSSYAIGDIVYASGAAALTRLADVASGNALLSGGVGIAPAYGKVGLTTHVSGVLPPANGGTGIGTALTPGSVIFAGPGGVLAQDNANFFWDDTQNALGIGTTSLTGYSLRLVTNLTGATTVRGISVEGTVQSDVTASAFGIRSNMSTAAAAFTLSAIQNFRVEQGTYGAGSTVTNHTGYHCGPLIGAAINYGFRAVDASAVTAGKQNYAFLAENSIATGGGTTWNFFASGTAPNYMAGALGIGNTPFTHVTLRVSKGITGATDAYGVLSDGVIQSDVTNSSAMFRSVVSTATAAFNNANVRHFEANQGALGAGSTITNQIGYIVSSSLIGAVNNFGFFGDIPAGANRWNLYMSGTADNFMQGALGIGQLSAATVSLRVAKNITGTNTTSITVDPVVQSDVSGTSFGVTSAPTTVAAGFILGAYNHFRATQIGLGAGSSVTTQTAYSAGQMTQATTNTGFLANNGTSVGPGKTSTGFQTNMDIASGGGTTWAYLATGTALSAFAGAVRIGSLTAPTFTLEVTGTVGVSGQITAGTSVRTGSYTVATLPSASASGIGSRAAVVDSNATIFSNIVAGGGSAIVPVYSDGANWRLG